MIRTKRGLDLPISGSPQQTVEDGRPARSVALLGFDYPGLKPTMEVAEGDRVTAGQLVFTDKKTPGVKFTAPATGRVAAINRGAKRAFLSLVIDVEDGEETEFQAFDPSEIASISREKVVEQLIESGEWTSLRNRPFGKVPLPESVPADIFVTAIDTRPLTADPSLFINEHPDAFKTGVEIMTLLTEGKVFVCKGPGPELPAVDHPRVQVEEFSGPHPAGLPSTHIHFLSPVSTSKSVWHINYQNLVAIGHLFRTGKLLHDRIVALAGPSVENPRLLRTRTGACTDELTAGELKPENVRVISGSVLDGLTAAGPTAYLGRSHNQVSVLREGTDREFLGFLAPGFNKFSVTRLFMAVFSGSSRRFDLTTSTGGSDRAMVPTGMFEEMMPLDILPTQLLRALLTSDIDSAIQLGCLELDEEDLALCTFCCAGKYEYGPYLRHMLSRIEAEG